MILILVVTVSFVYIVTTNFRYKALKVQYEDMLHTKAQRDLVTYLQQSKEPVKSIEEYPHSRGIYLYEHKRSGKCYIGKSVNMRRRAKQHFSANSRATVDIHFIKYSDYNYYILDRLPESTTTEQLHQAERFWINSYIYTGHELLNSTL